MAGEDRASRADSLHTPDLQRVIDTARAGLIAFLDVVNQMRADQSGAQSAKITKLTLINVALPRPHSSR